MEKRIIVFLSVIFVALIALQLFYNPSQKNYIRQLKEIKAAKDSLDNEILRIKNDLKTRDSLLVKNITQSQLIIDELEKKISISKNKYQSYKNSSDSIIKKLNNLCQ